MRKSVAKAIKPPPVDLDDPRQLKVRIAACYGLLAHAALEIGIKAEGSSKLTRAIEDVVQARDALGEITERFASTPLTDENRTAVLDARTIQGMVFTAQRDYTRNWQYWRERKAEVRRG